MDGEGSSAPVLWHDRGEVAKDFDVCIFKLRNLDGSQFILGVHSGLDDVLS